MEISLEIRADSPCEKCKENLDEEALWLDYPSYDIKVKDGLIVCKSCETPINSGLEVDKPE